MKSVMIILGKCNNVRCDTEIKKRKRMAKEAFQKLEKVLKNRTLAT